MKTIEQLYTEAMADDNIIQEYRRAEESGAVGDFLKAHDCGATEQELNTFLEGLEKRGELSDDELDDVAAGKKCGDHGEYIDGYRVCRSDRGCKEFRCLCGKKYTFLNAWTGGPSYCTGCKTRLTLCENCAKSKVISGKRVCTDRRYS